MTRLTTENQTKEKMSVIDRLKHRWKHSLSFRLLWLGLMPMLLALPVVLTFVGLAGQAQLNRLINGQLTSNLSGAQNYLHVFETGLRTRIAEFAKSGPLTQIAQEQAHNSSTDQLLAATIRGIGVDFLLLLGPDKKVIASCHPHGVSGKVPASSVIEQAQIGVASSGFEQFTVQELAVFSPAIAERLQTQMKQTEASRTSSEDEGQRKVTVLMTAAHLPLSVNGLDAVLVGGVLIDENAALIEHLREIVYPTGQLPDRAEGFAGIFVGQHSIVNSRLLAVNNFTPVLEDPVAAVDRFAEGAREAIAVQKLGGKNYALAVSPIQSSQQSTIALLAVGFPVEPFQKIAWLLLSMLTGLLGLSMLAVSLIYLNAGRGIVQEVKKIAAAMRDFRQGNRAAQITRIQSEDELGALGQDVNALLRLVAEQEKEQIAAQQVISDEAMRRRAIFQNVRDGIAILDQHGEVFEVNDQLCVMLGYSEQELRQLQTKDWDKHFSHSDLLAQAGQARALEIDTGVFESVHRRKDGSEFPVELSVSHGAWAGQSFYIVLSRDITQRKEQEDKLKLSASVFTAALEAIVLADARGLITDVNDAYTHITGYSKAEVIGQLAFGAERVHNQDEIYQSVSASLQSRGSWSGEIVQRRKRGDDFPSQVKISAVKNHLDQAVHYVVTFSDISLQKQQQIQLEHIALHDGLTGLGNRQHFTQRMALAMGVSKRYRSHAALIMLDLDNFKPLNDTHGHTAGDQLLIEVGRRIQANVREVDTVIRYGGDEFLVLLESLSEDAELAQTQALKVAEKIREVIDRPFMIRVDESDHCTDIVHRCTSSIGVTVFLGDELSQSQLLNQADAAMYAAKEQGKNRVSLSRLLETPLMQGA